MSLTNRGIFHLNCRHQVLMLSSYYVYDKSWKSFTVLRIIVLKILTLYITNPFSDVCHTFTKTFIKYVRHTFIYKYVYPYVTIDERYIKYSSNKQLTTFYIKMKSYQFRWLLFVYFISLFLPIRIRCRKRK